MKQLQQIYDDLSTLTDEDLVLDYSDKLTTINDTFNDNTSDEEFDLMNRAEDMLEMAKDHFENIHRQEELDQEMDERKYAGAHHLS
jgi:hypothetical protein